MFPDVTAIKKSVFVAFLMIASSCSATENESVECSFDPEYFSIDRYIENPLVKFVEWNDELYRAAIVTADGDLLSIQHWSCNHVGLDAELYVRGSNADEDALLTKLESLVTIVLGDDVASAALTTLSTTSVLDGESTIEIPSDRFSEFSVSSRRSDDTMILNIGYYFD